MKKLIIILFSIIVCSCKSYIDRAYVDTGITINKFGDRLCIEDLGDYSLKEIELPRHIVSFDFNKEKIINGRYYFLESDEIRTQSDVEEKIRSDIRNNLIKKYNEKFNENYTRNHVSYVTEFTFLDQNLCLFLGTIYNASGESLWESKMPYNCHYTINAKVISFQWNHNPYLAVFITYRATTKRSTLYIINKDYKTMFREEFRAPYGIGIGYDEKIGNFLVVKAEVRKLGLGKEKHYNFKSTLAYSISSSHLYCEQIYYFKNNIDGDLLKIKEK